MNIRYYEKRPGQWWLDFRDATGTRKRVPAGQATEAAARRVAPSIVGSVLSNVATKPPIGDVPSSVVSTLTLQEAFDTAMRNHEGWVASKDKATLRQTFEALGDPHQPIASFNREKVLDLRAKWKLAPGKRKDSTLSHSTINHRLSMLSVLIEQAELPPHTVRHLSTKGNSRKRRISDQELQAMQDWCFQHAAKKGALDFAHLITLGMETAAREGELLGLRTADVTGDQATFRDTKNGETRTIPLTEAAQRVLEARRRFGVPTFFHGLNQDRVTHLWAEMRKDMGLAEDVNFVFHLLRHERLSRLSDSGASAFIIMALAGHANITTSQGYVQASLGSVRQAMQQLETTA